MPLAHALAALTLAGFQPGFSRSETRFGLVLTLSVDWLHEHKTPPAHLERQSLAEDITAEQLLASRLDKALESTLWRLAEQLNKPAADRARQALLKG